MVLDDSGYSSTLKGINSELKNNKSQLRAVSSGLEAFGHTTQNVNRVQETLKRQLELQAKKVDLYKESIKKATGTLEENIDKREKLKKSIEQEKAKLDSLQKTYGSNNEAVRNSEKKLQELQEQYERTDKSIENNAKRIQNYETNLNKAQGEVNKTTSSINKFNKELENVDGFKSTKKKLEETSTSFKNFGEKAENIGGKLTSHVSLPLLGVGVAASKVGIDFEAQMDKVAAISGATGDDFKKLESKAEEMGAKTKFSASEAGQGLEYMAMAGWKTNDMLEGIEPILNLAIASNEELGTTSDIVTDALTAFGLKAKDTTMFTDVLATASSNANTNVGMMGETFKYAAPVMGALGYSVKDTALGIGLMANNGIKASQAGTALRAGLTNLVKPTDAIAAAMKRYGISVKDGHGKMKTFKNIMVELREKLGHLDKATQAATVSQIFGKEAMSGWLAIINSSKSDFDKLSDSIDNSEGATSKMAKTMSNNAKGSLAEMTSALEGAGIKAFKALAPAITSVANSIGDLANDFSKLSPETQGFIVKAGMIAMATGPVISGIGNMSKGIGGLISIGSKLGGLCSLVTTGLGTVSSATAGATIAAEGATIAAGGLGATVAAVAAPIAIGVAAIAGIGYVAYKTSEKLNSSATPAVDLFADKVVDSTRKIKNGNQEIQAVTGRTTVKISESTKKSISDYIDLDKKASNSLMNLRINSDKFTKDAKNKVVKNFTDMSKKSSSLSKEQRERMTIDFKKLVSDTGNLTKKNKDEIIKQYTLMVNGTKGLSKKQKEQTIKDFTDTLNKSTSITKKQSDDIQKLYKDMGDKIKVGLDKNKEDELKSLKDFFGKSNALTVQEEADILKKTNESWSEKKKDIDEWQKQINEIIKKAADEHRHITNDESKIIADIQKKMKENAVKTLSENEVQAKVILERMKEHDNNITAEQASEHIKKLNELKDKSVKAANEECDKRIAEIIRMRDESKVISKDQADKLIEDAKRQKKETVEAAEGTRKEAVEKITSMNSTISENVDTTTGNVLTNWQKFANWWDKWWPEPKTLSVKETGGSPNPMARRQYGHKENWTGNSWFKGGYTTLHERGYELYDLPEGTKIYNHESSEAMVKASAEKAAELVVGNILSRLPIANQQQTRENPNVTIKTDLHIETLNEGTKEDLERMLEKSNRDLLNRFKREFATY